MELSHAISDAVLTLTGVFVFFKYIKPLASRPRLLWSAFILSVTTAAFFGTIRFLGYPQARSVSEIFQHLAGTAGAICLVLATYMGATQRKVSNSYFWGALLAGVVLFLWAEIGQNAAIVQYTSFIAIPLVVLMGIWGWAKGRRTSSGWLILGVLFLVVATFSKAIAVRAQLDAVDCYHYLLAISVFCFGKAA